MKKLPHPISFPDTATMNRMYALAESQIIKISERYNEPTLPNSINIFRNEATNTMEMRSVGSYLDGSKREKAIDEIIDRFEAIFGG